MGLIEMVKTFANLFVVWLVVMGFFPLTDVQQATTVSLVMAAINIGGWVIQRGIVTPISDPKIEAKDGELVSLVRADGKPLKA